MEWTLVIKLILAGHLTVHAQGEFATEAQCLAAIPVEMQGIDPLATPIISVACEVRV